MDFVGWYLTVFLFLLGSEIVDEVGFDVLK